MRAILVMILGMSCLYGSESVIRGNLQWQDNADAKTVIEDWDGAKSYCANLTLEGYRDWRLPSIKELQSIVDRKKRDPAIKAGFSNTESGWYWSASPDVRNGSFAWIVYFGNGSTDGYAKINNLCVRCVRGRQ
jgi:formylglycine-generating enzyme required for sulfatase activity